MGSNGLCRMLLDRPRVVQINLGGFRCCPGEDGGDFRQSVGRLPTPVAPLGPAGLRVTRRGRGPFLRSQTGRERPQVIDGELAAHQRDHQPAGAGTLGLGRAAAQVEVPERQRWAAVGRQAQGEECGLGV